MTSPTQFPVLEGLSEREQRAACVAFFESELTRLGLKRDEKWDRIMGELRTGIKCERPRVTTSDKPAPGYPAPWRWTGADVDRFGPSALEATDGSEVFGVAYDPDEEISPHILIDSPIAGELVRSAPEMETLLRAIETNFTNICPACDRTRSGGHEPGCAFEALIARLDAARKAGG